MKFKMLVKELYIIATALSCILMIIIAKILGLLIKRPENYYNKNNKIEIDQ